MFNKNGIRDMIYCLLSSYLILMVSLYIFPWTVFIMAAPFVVLWVKRTYIYGLSSFFIMSVSLIFIFDMSSAIFFGFTFLLFIAIMAETIKRGFSSNKVILFSVGAIIMTVILGLAYNYGLKKIDIISKFESVIRFALEENIDNLKNLNLSEKSLEEFKFVLTKSVDVVIVGLPATIFILSIAATLVNYLISVNFLRYLNIGIVDKFEFSRFRLPKNIFLGILVILVSFYVFKIMEFKYLFELQLNISAILTSLFFIQGLAVSDYYMKKFFGLFGRIAVPILTVYFLHLFFIYPVVGFLDSIFNLRKGELTKK